MEGILEIAKFWFQDAELTSTEIHPKVIKIMDGKQSYILKEKGSMPQVLAEVNVLNVLFDKGVKVQRPLKTIDDESYILHHDKYYCMYEYLDGSAVEVKNVEMLNRLAGDIGKEVAKLHQVFSTLHNEGQFVENNLYSVLYQWAMPILKNNEQVHPKVIQTMMHLQNDFEECLESLPKQLIHRDVHLSNLVFKENIFQGFIDFELAEINIRVFDLCYCFTSILSEIFTDEELRSNWLHIVREIFEGYHKKNALTGEEIQAIWYVMLGIQVIFSTYFVQSSELLKLNEEMFFWILANKKAIEEEIM